MFFYLNFKFYSELFLSTCRKTKFKDECVQLQRPDVISLKESNPSSPYMNNQQDGTRQSVRLLKYTYSLWPSPTIKQ